MEKRWRELEGEIEIGIKDKGLNVNEIVRKRKLRTDGIGIDE